MSEPHNEIMVGVLGQWASGKSTAACTLIEYLGGKNEVSFITDRELLAGLAVGYIHELGESEVEIRTESDGKQRIEGELVTIYLKPGEDLKSADLKNLMFDLCDDIYDNVPIGSKNWLEKARIELGQKIIEKSAHSKPIVIEAGFGTNLEPRGENPFSHTVRGLFQCLEHVSVDPKQIMWIIIEAGYDIRAARNRNRKDRVPDIEFDRFAADGGDLDPDYENQLVEMGMRIRRVNNNQNDIEKFRADIVTSFDEMFGGQFPNGTIGGIREQK